MLAQGRLSDSRHAFDFADGMRAIQQGREDCQALGLCEEAQPLRKITTFFESKKGHERGLFG
ncbi:hypothetical protein AA3271_1748 [Gluconobacter japonicus NBRC 3271]|nr:hypothetical protein AA3271_1748 [Gluconobacter japonicus NBRC 3271]